MSDVQMVETSINDRLEAQKLAIEALWPYSLGLSYYDKNSMRNSIFILPRVLRWAAVVAALVIGLVALVSFLQPGYSASLGDMHLHVGTDVPAEATWWLRAPATLLPAAAFACAMAQLAALLKLVERGEVFSEPASRYLRRFGVWLLVATLAGVLCPFAAQVIHSLMLGSGESKLELSSREAWNIFLSALFMLVARVLSDAYRLAEENRQII